METVERIWSALSKGWASFSSWIADPFIRASNLVKLLIAAGLLTAGWHLIARVITWVINRPVLMLLHQTRKLKEKLNANLDAEEEGKIARELKELKARADTRAYSWWSITTAVGPLLVLLLKDLLKALDERLPSSAPHGSPPGSPLPQ